MDKVGVIVLLVCLIGCFLYLTYMERKLKRPRFLKPLSFFEMTNDSDLLEFTVDCGVEVNVHYASSFLMGLTEGGE